MQLPISASLFPLLWLQCRTRNHTTPQNTPQYRSSPKQNHHHHGGSSLHDSHCCCCRFWMDEEEEYRRFIRRSTLQIGKYYCSHCDSSFLYVGGLKAHVAYHKECIYLCGVKDCHAIYQNQSNLELHCHYQGHKPQKNHN